MNIKAKSKVSKLREKIAKAGTEPDRFAEKEARALGR